MIVGIIADSCFHRNDIGQTQGSAPTVSICSLLFTIYSRSRWLWLNGETIGTLTLILSLPTPRLRQAGHQGRGSKRGNNNELGNKEKQTSDTRYHTSAEREEKRGETTTNSRICNEFHKERRIYFAFISRIRARYIVPLRCHPGPCADPEINSG